MSLFQLGEFVPHSGGRSNYTIDCRRLTPSDWEALAVLAKERVGEFGLVVGVPTGGLNFARALWRHRTPGDETVLVCDDVMTTGRSMEEFRKAIRHPSAGVVAFARSPCPNWVMPLFVLGSTAR